jgi:hypothetical protein
MADVYYSLIVDDDDDDSGDGDGGDGDGGDGGDGGGGLDTQWITAYENDILLSEYQLFLKSDITRISFRFIYLDRDKKCVEFVIPMAGLYPLQHVNQISQSEIFQIIQRNQTPPAVMNGGKKKYYNFHSLLLYNFQLEDDNVIRSVAEYISSETENVGDFGGIIEYTNILSFDIIYFKPMIEMFHDLVGFTVVLYED